MWCPVACKFPALKPGLLFADCSCSKIQTLADLDPISLSLICACNFFFLVKDLEKAPISRPAGNLQNPVAFLALGVSVE
jgi:hypothetical protein